jgi:hypothetical protein
MLVPPELKWKPKPDSKTLKPKTKSQQFPLSAANAGVRGLNIRVH